MDAIWIPVIAITACAVIPISIVTVTQIVKYKLKVEQIKADAMVRAEEVRARNQLEIEKLFYQNHQTSATNAPIDTAKDTAYDPSYLERPSRNRERR